MADTKAIANRINSIKDTKKITNAMYLISSTKLRKARKSLEDIRPFFAKLREQIGNIVRKIDVKDSRYLVYDDDPVVYEGRTGILVMTADKGLAGAYNQDVIKEALRIMGRHPDYVLFVMGEYGKHYFASHHIPVDEHFNFADIEPSLYQARMMAGNIMDRYDRGEIDSVYVIYTDFRNALASEAVTYRLLPFKISHFTESLEEEEVEFEYVPSPMEVMEKCIPVYCIGVIYSIMVYSFCCEQNDRMMAMDAANKNADDLISTLTVQYNRLRQGRITQEITEISASVKAGKREKNQ